MKFMIMRFLVTGGIEEKNDRENMSVRLLFVYVAKLQKKDVS